MKKEKRQKVGRIAVAKEAVEKEVEKKTHKRNVIRLRFERV